MNLLDYIEQIKGWIGRQCFLVRHYRIAIFYILYTGFSNDSSWHFFYPHEEEHINIFQLNQRGTIDNQRKVDDSIVKGRLLYDVSSVERPHPWREVFKDISSTDLLSQSDKTKDMDNDLDTISDDETSLSDSKKISNKRTSRQHRSTKNQTIKTDRKNKRLE